MLNIFRKNKSSIFGLVIIGFLALLMLPFGIDSLNQQNTKAGVIAVYGKEIPESEYYRLLHRWQNVFRQQLGENYSKVSAMLNIETRAMDELINGAILDTFGTEAGFGAGTEQLKDRIAANPFFEGLVTKARYQEYLSSANLTGEALEALTRREIVGQQLQMLLSDLNIPSSQELKAAHRDQNRQASFRYLTFSPEEFKAKVNTSDEGRIKAFYDEHAEDYRTRKASSFSFVAFKPEDFENTVELTEDDIEEAYEQTKNRFSEPSMVHLRSIKFKKKQKSALEDVLGEKSVGDKDPDQALESKLDENDLIRQKAEQVVERLENGESFADLAVELSEDKETSASGGDLGWVRYPVLEAAVRKAAAGLEQGEHSQVLQTNAGFEIIYVEDKKERRIKEISAVRKEIEETLRKADAPAYARAAAEEFLSKSEGKKNASGGEISLKEAAADANLKIVSTDKPLSRGDSAPGISSELSKEVGLLAQGVRDVLQIGDTSYVVEVQDISEPKIPALAEVRTQAIEDFKTAEAEAIAKEAAENALQRLLAVRKEQQNTGQSGEKTLTDIAAEQSLRVATTESAARDSAKGPIFASPEARRELFTLQPTNPVLGRVLDIGSTRYVVELAGETLPDEGQFAGKLDEIRSAERTKGGQRLSEAVMLALRKEADVSFDPKLLEYGKQ